MNDEAVKQFLFELTDKTLRFFTHLDDIKTQFYNSGEGKINDKLIFLQSYKTCLLKILRINLSLIKEVKKENSDKERIFLVTKNAINSLNQLHEHYLTHLPRPTEPKELNRFSRIIDKHLFKINNEQNNAKQDSQENNQEHTNKEKDISIFVSEEVSESIYAEDPLAKFKKENLSSLITCYNGYFSDNISQTTKRGDETHHIKIPRIEANNPYYWPTLIHELGHKIIDPKFFKEKNIYSDFWKSIDDTSRKYLDDCKKEYEIESWLIECWCDLFACIVFGPAFWFSQFLSFTSQGEIFSKIKNKKYPPPYFRLKLIAVILSHRFSKSMFDELENSLNECQSLVETLDTENNRFSLTNDDKIKNIYSQFKNYFFTYFTGKEDGYSLEFYNKNLNEYLSNFFKYNEDINYETIKSLKESFKKGLPAPSKFIKKNNSISQKPAYLQEILLASWLYRNNEYKDEILDEFNKIKFYSYSKLEKDVYAKVIGKMERFDQSVLRSIQVSEWFDLFYQESQVKYENTNFLNKQRKSRNQPKVESQNQLVDFEIFDKLLEKDGLKIIPIMNLEQQLGSSSFDVRLGTSFQIYHTSKFGEMDYLNDPMESHFESRLLDLDFLESIYIYPGQFLLGHTMEYLKLPENLSAEIEGRSSFARLGLVVHMTAGFVDPGFDGVLTLEFYNSGPNPIKLYPGLRIAQLKFIPVNGPIKPYNKRHNTKYKGLLSHNTSLQIEDYELTRIYDKIKGNKKKFR